MQRPFSTYFHRLICCTLLLVWGASTGYAQKEYDSEDDGPKRKRFITYVSYGRSSMDMGRLNQFLASNDHQAINTQLHSISQGVNSTYKKFILGYDAEYHFPQEFNNLNRSNVTGRMFAARFMLLGGVPLLSTNKWYGQLFLGAGPASVFLSADKWLMDKDSVINEDLDVVLFYVNQIAFDGNLRMSYYFRGKDADPAKISPVLGVVIGYSVAANNRRWNYNGFTFLEPAQDLFGPYAKVYLGFGN